MKMMLVEVINEELRLGFSFWRFGMRIEGCVKVRVSVMHEVRAFRIGIAIEERRVDFGFRMLGMRIEGWVKGR